MVELAEGLGFSRRRGIEHRFLPGSWRRSRSSSRLLNSHRSVIGSTRLESRTIHTEDLVLDPSTELGVAEPFLEFLADMERPLLVISPYAKCGVIDYHLGEFSSVLRFIENSWCLTQLMDR